MLRRIQVAEDIGREACPRLTPLRRALEFRLPRIVGQSCFCAREALAPQLRQIFFRYMAHSGCKPPPAWGTVTTALVSRACTIKYSRNFDLHEGQINSQHEIQLGFGAQQCCMNSSQRAAIAEDILNHRPEDGELGRVSDNSAIPGHSTRYIECASLTRSDRRVPRRPCPGPCGGSFLPPK